uniref:USP domain-containing protein n=1 Tax=Parastrongyloides trichosuri TaxID=131310 RepID=A0A0N4ZVP1_PARTI
KLFESFNEINKIRHKKRYIEDEENDYENNSPGLFLPLGQYSSSFESRMCETIKEFDDMYMGLMCGGGACNQLFFKSKSGKDTSKEAFYVMGNLYEYHYHHRWITAPHIISHFYRCADCVAVKAKETRNNIYLSKISSKESKQAATIILAYDIPTRILFGYRENIQKHHPLCQKEYLRNVYSATMTEFINLVRTRKGASSKILKYMVPRAEMRDQCSRFTGYSNINRFKLIEELRFTYDSYDDKKDLLLRYENDEEDLNCPVLNYDVYAKSKYLILTSKKLLKAMSESDILASDGTYSTFPNEKYKCLYTIHAIMRKEHNGEIRERFFHVCVILVINEQQETYNMAFSKLVNILVNEMNITLKCQTWFVDKQRTIINCIRHFFKHVNISLCFFHYTNNVVEKLREYGLTVTYTKFKNEDKNLYHRIKRLFVVVFMPEDEIRSTYEEIKDDILKIFEGANNKCWIYSKDIPLSSICKYMTRHRTTNVCEAFHKKLSVLGFSNSKCLGYFGISMKKLLFEEELGIERLQMNRYKVLKNQRVEYKERNANLNEASEAYCNKDIDVFQYLDRVANYVILEEHKKLYNDRQVVNLEDRPIVDGLDGTQPDRSYFPTDINTPVNEPLNKRPRLQKKIETNSQSSTRKIWGYKGIKNIGQSCYANASLQLLFNCSDFVKKIGNYEGNNDMIKALNVFASEYFKENQNLSNNCLSSVDPTNLYSILRKNEYLGRNGLLNGQQHDSAEFIASLLTKIEEIAPNMMEAFYFSITKHYKCENESCLKSFYEETTQSFLIFSIGRDYTGISFSIMDLFNNMLKENVLLDKTMRCPHCKLTPTCFIKNTFSKYPKYLVVQLERKYMIDDVVYHNDSIIYIVRPQLHSKKFVPPSPYKIKEYISFEGIDGIGHYIAHVR